MGLVTVTVKVLVSLKLSWFLELMTEMLPEQAAKRICREDKRKIKTRRALILMK